jgi:hypothetical protein
MSFSETQYVNKGSHTALVNKCSSMSQLKGVGALRLSYMYDGSDENKLKIPPIEIFIEKKYKKYDMAQLSID